MSEQKSLVDALVAAVARPVPVDNRVVALPPGWKSEDLGMFDERPRRTKQHVQHYDLDSFLRYVREMRLPNTAIFVRPDLSLTNDVFATAVIDYHGKDEPAWGGHIATYVPRIHWAYALLVEMQTPVPQSTFVDKLRKLERFVTSMKHADLIEMVRTMTVAVSGKISNVRDDLTGSLNFAVERTQRGVLERSEQSLPSIIGFTLPTIMGQDAREVSCDLRFDVRDRDDGQTVVFSLRIRDREGSEEDVVDSILRVLEMRLHDCPTYRAFLGK